MKILSVVGARPNFIKMYPLIKALKDTKHENLIVHTGQHYDRNMSDVFFKEIYPSKPDYNLNIGSGSHGIQMGQILHCVEEVILKEKPDMVIVPGDTNSTLGGALAATKQHVIVAHLEAGLRSYNKRMPEEINRLMIDAISSILFAPSQQAEINLLWEGKPRNRIFMCGNTQKDVLQHTIQTKSSIELPQGVKPPYGVITIHRAENTDNLKRLKEIITGIINIYSMIQTTV